MKLHRLTDHCWYSDSAPDTDRPSLGYIVGTNGKSVVVDAGNSEKHYREFLDLLDSYDLPMPSMCVLTHSHWDHVLGMAATAVPTIAHVNTQRHLQEMCEWSPIQVKEFFSENEFAQIEYKDSLDIHPQIATISFSSPMTIYLGSIQVQLLPVINPHSDDGVIIYVPTDGMIYAGDSSAGDFSLPNIAYVPELFEEYIAFITSLDFNWFLHSHREPTDRVQTLQFLRDAKERGYYTF